MVARRGRNSADGCGEDRALQRGGACDLKHLSLATPCACTAHVDPISMLMGHRTARKTTHG